ncbi:NAD-binding protein [Terricaulis sp.]|uniref:NAD-binding protein n=1 Tax=Terricaulis sp. TaxID=2768686 RepID=UPI003784C260
MADAPKNTGWKHRRGGLLTPVRRFISNNMSKPLLRAAHRRTAPIRLLIGVIVTGVWLWYGVTAAWDYGMRESASPPPQAQVQQQAQAHAAPPPVRALANSLCVLRGGKPCDYDEHGRSDGRVFFAQTALAIATILTLLFGFWTQLLGAMAHALRAIGEGHVIVAGASSEAETLARNAARRGAVVLIRRSVSSAELDAMAADGIAVVAGPPTDPAVLRAAGVKAADRVVAISGDDAENVGIAAAVNDVRGRTQPGDVLVRVEDAELRSYLPSRGKLRAADLFSLSEIAARLFTVTPDLLREAKVRGQPRVHLGVVGWSEEGVAAIARVFRIMWAPPFEAPRISVFVEDTEAARADFKSRYPNAFSEKVWQADIEFLPFNWRGRVNPWVALRAAEAERGPLTAVLVAPPAPHDAADRPGQHAKDDTLACAAALSRYAAKDSIPIYARENNDGSIGISLESEDGASVIPFGAPAEVLSADALIDRGLDDAAVALHEAYLETCVLNQGDNKKEYERALRQRGADGADIAALEARLSANALAAVRKRVSESLLARGKFKTPDDRPAQVRWDKLAETYITGNRTGADHAVMKVWSYGYSPAPKGKRGKPVPAADATQINDLDCALEHRRWAADLLLTGWRYGPKRDDIEMTHPDLLPYADFPADKKDEAVAKDRDPWLKAPVVAGMIYPERLFVKDK